MTISRHWLGLWLTVEQAKLSLEPMMASLLTHIVTWAQCVNWLCSPNTKVTNLISISENDISFSKNEGTGTFYMGAHYLTSQLFLVCRCNQSKRFEPSGYSWETDFEESIGHRHVGVLTCFVIVMYQHFHDIFLEMVCKWKLSPKSGTSSQLGKHIRRLG